MTNEDFYCKFEIYKVVQTTEHGLTYEVDQHVMWVTAETEAEFLMWDKAVKQTEGLYIDSDVAVLSDWAWDMHHKRDLDNGVQQFQTSEGG